jgi:hypothetical protein
VAAKYHSTKWNQVSLDKWLEQEIRKFRSENENAGRSGLQVCGLNMGGSGRRMESLNPAWAKEQIPSQPELYTETFVLEQNKTQ